MDALHRSAAERLAAAGRSFSARGWMLGTAGNLSERVSKSGAPLRYLITASGVQKDELGSDDFICFSSGMQDPEPPDRRASAETEVHDRLYARFGAGAVVHVHAPYMTLVSRAALAAGSVEIEGWEYLKGLGRWEEGAHAQLPIVANHHSIPELARDLVDSARDDMPAVLVAGHGAYAWGDSLHSARRHIECVEFLCRMIWEEWRAGLRLSVAHSS